MAVATSLTSARVGVGDVIIDFEHLRRDHDRLSELTGRRDDLVLKRRHLLRRQLDSEIAARDHHRVRKGDDVVQTIDRRRFLDLRKQCRAVADQLPRFGYVLGPLHEGQRNPVGPLIQRELQIVAVLVGERWNRHHDVGDIDALVVGHGTADLHLADDLVAVDFEDVQADLAVVDQDLRSCLDRFEKLGMWQQDTVAVACRLLAVEDEALPLLEDRPPPFEMTYSQLRPLKVEQDCRGAMEFLLERTDMLDQLRLLLLVSVAHVDSEGVCAGEHQAADHLGIARRRAERGQDLHFAVAGCEGFYHAHCLVA